MRSSEAEQVNELLLVRRKLKNLARAEERKIHMNNKFYIEASKKQTHSTGNPFALAR